MGNQQASLDGSYPNSAENSTLHLATSIKKSAGKSRFRMADLLELRRRSVGNTLEALKKAEANAQNNYNSFTYGQSPLHSIDGEQSTSSDERISEGGKHKKPLPRIEINGVINEPVNKEKEEMPTNGNEMEKDENGAIENVIVLPRKNSSDERRGSGVSLPSYSKHRAQKVDSRKIVARRRLERGQTTTNVPPSNNGGIFTKNTTAKGKHPLMVSLRASELQAHSLDNHVKYNTEIHLEMKPLNIRSARSVSPLLHQQRRFGSTGGHRGSIMSRNSFSGDEGILSKEQSEAIQQSWKLAKERIDQFAGKDRCFGFFAFDRIFERAPELKPMFGISPNMSLIDMDEQEELHPFVRHTRIFNNILDLAVRNADELESEMLPALFTYGQRHYRPKIIDQFNERTIRLFCSQIVGTICDLLDEQLTPFAQEAWIEMVTYLGRALLSGFEHERQRATSTKRFSLQKIH